MVEAVPYLLWSAILVAPLVAGWLRGALGFASALLGAWLLLPVAAFPDSAGSPLGLGPMSAGSPLGLGPMGLAVPHEFQLDKATSTALALLVALIVFERDRLRALRPSPFDLVALGFCAWPLVSGLLNDLELRPSLGRSAQATLGWGVLWLVGRTAFRSAGDFQLLARVWLAAALLLLPFFAVELVSGPVFYGFAYGFHPFELDGAERYLGFRPLLLFEHGNQLGVFMAGSAVVAYWTWRHGAFGRVLGLPLGAVVLLLGAAALATQSAGAIALAAFGALALELSGRTRPSLVWGTCALLALGVGGLRVTFPDLATRLVAETTFGRDARDLLKQVGRGSLGWRVKNDEIHLPRVMERPGVGWGRADWWDWTAAERPWGLWLLMLGAFGAVGFGLMSLLVLGPLATLAIRGPPGAPAEGSAAALAALGAFVVICFLDAALNSTFLLPAVAISGGAASLVARPPDSA